MTVIWAGMHGLGDNLYQRAVIRRLKGPQYLMTPWPQLYADLDVRCIRPQTRLRTQAKNAARNELKWAAPPKATVRRPHYVGHDGTMLEGLCRAFGVRADAINFDGPPVEKKPGRYIVVRPATIRAEWRADARNPLPEYIAQAVDALRREYQVISIADLKPGAEWALDPLPYADETYHGGELSLEALLELVAGASAVVGGVGWLVPAAVAYRVPMLLIYGGWGHANGPQRIFDARMDTSLIDQVMPDRFCMCKSAGHVCDKTISNLGGRVERFALGLSARPVTAMAA